MKTAIVTGGTKGIGLVTAKKLAARGLRVVVTGRTQSTCDDAAKEIAPNASGAALDLASLDSVRAFAARFEGPLDLLVNNAGNMSLDPKATLTKDGIETTLATNVIGPFLLTRLLLPKLRESAPSRVVNVGSRAHLPKSGYGAEVNWDWDNMKGEKSYEPMTFYKNSKLALMWITYELDRRLDKSGVVVNAVCPGFVPATVGEHATGVRRFLFKHVMPHMPGAHTPDEAAENTLFVATDAKYEKRGGAFVGEKNEVKSSEESYDEAKAARFWKLACDLAGVPEAV
ncbi:MAG TPA: SDR family NAD(P)-dependent oxidoreductase [Polyangiaceae bacterium]|jgi:NAD(P)-dependent dehydrogenase (short-subunit alcohol dehydrogenase family)